MADHPPVRLHEQLLLAGDFDAAAVACLRHMLDMAQATLEASDFPNGLLLRGLIHLRPDDEYSGLYLMERGAEGLSTPGPSSTLLHSASVWRHVTRHGEAAAVDVGLRAIHPRRSPSQPLDPTAATPDMSRVSMLRLQAREVTHLYALPLHVPGGRVVGMITLEAACTAALGEPFIWPACADALEAAAALAGPYLASLPQRAPEAAITDELLPVVGPTMAPVVQVLRAFSAEEETLLIRGETGTGKSRIARWCHAHSGRARGPFEVLDLLSVPEEMQMGELMGWRRGAFTGAIGDHDGFVTRANGGTLFIDEIDKLSMAAQAGLLFLLEERRFRILGDSRGPRQADVRFIVGTNTDLAEAVREGRFREDLYYRINVLPMVLPALRDRPDEIGQWASFMLQRRHEEKGGAGTLTLPADAELLLRNQTWQGNLREMDNVLRRAYTLATIDAREHLLVEARHVQAALLFGGGRPAEQPLSLVAGALTALCSHLTSSRPPIRLNGVDVPGALHGLLLAEAVRVSGGRDEAFHLLGRGELTANRNHHRVLRRQCARAAELFDRLGETLPPEVAELL